MGTLVLNEHCLVAGPKRGFPKTVNITASISIKLHHTNITASLLNITALCCYITASLKWGTASYPYNRLNFNITAA